MRKRILVIDDDLADLKLIRTVLEAEGHEVVTFEDFEKALLDAKEKMPDLVLTDVVMPKISGFDVCRKIKAMFQPKPPLVIVMTGRLDAVDPILARKMGADDFVVKISGNAALVQAVREIFSEKGGV